MIRMLPFIYSSEIAYEIELGEFYAKFYYDSGALLDADEDEVIIATPYLEADIAALHIEQIADTMWITHKSYAPRKLTRTTAVSFSLDVIVFTDGPFEVRNDIINEDDVTMTSDVTAVDDTGTLTSSAATFVDDHVGALWSLNYPRDLTIVSLAATGDTSATPLDVEGIFRVTTKNRWAGTVELYRQVNGTGYDVFRTWKSNLDYNISYTRTENEKNVQYYIKAIGITGTFGADLSVNDHTQTGVVRIDSLTSSTVADVTVMEVLPATNGLVATKRWAEGAWSPLRGYPVSVTFLQERCIYAGNNSVYLSETGDYENFEEGSKDADSFSIVIPSTNPIRWVKAINDVIAIGTSGDEWTIASNKLGTPITPTNWIPEPQTTYGSSEVQPIRTNNVILFVDFVGRKIREFTLGGELGKYVAPDLTELAEHITESGITSIAFQKNPDEILWSTLTDGSLLSMTYERANNVIAWAKHPTTGDLESVSVIPQDDESQIWISVERDVNGVDIVLIEVFVPRIFDTISDCHFVDSAVFYDGVSATVITVGDHLIGKTVHILADGVVVTPQVVSAAGTITLTTAASKVHAGLQYKPKLEPMRPDIPTREGTSHGSLVKVSEMGISFLNAMNATFGVTDDDQYDIDFSDARWQNNTEITNLFTGDVVVAVDGGFSLDNNLIVSSDSPLPLTIRALVPKIERTGR